MLFTTRADLALDPQRDLKPACPSAPLTVSNFALRPPTTSRRKSERRKSRPTAGFASLTATLAEAVPGLGQAVKGQMVREPATGVEFDEEYCQRGNTSCGQLTGLGVRAKRIAGIKNINVYALGLYVEGDAARQALGKYQGQPAEAVKQTQSVYDDLIKADDVEKTLQVVIVSSRVNQTNFWSALEERLAPPLKQAGEDETLAQFSQAFDGVKFAKGLNLSFCIGKENVLVTKVDGEAVKTVKSPVLCHALLDIYLGKDPVAKSAKESFGQGLAALLA